LSRGDITSRVRDYDDITDNRVSRRGGTSSKLLFVTILLSLIICILAVLVWVNILKSKELTGKTSGTTAPVVSVVGSSTDSSSSQENTSKTVQTTQTTASSNVLPQEAPLSQTESTPNVSMDIDNALQIVGSNTRGQTSGDLTDYISSQDYVISADSSTDEVETRGVEIKKPAIAQNLSISQQSSLSRDIVKYTEYVIQEGDSLDSIAQKFGLTRETIISVNQIKSTTSLFIGSILQIPDRNGTLYTVKEGDTLSSIVQTLNLTLGWKALSDVNGLRNETVNVGDKLFIPLESVQETGTLNVSLEPSFSLPNDSAITVALYNQKVADPLGNSAIQLDGILLQASDGSPVTAAEAGTVIDRGFNDNGTGFIKILHSSGYTTYYDYVSNICVNSTDRVSKGDIIGYFANGSTNLLNPTIFFRIEQDGIPLDPYSFL